MPLLLNRLASYLPLAIARRLASSGKPTEPRTESSLAAVLFADISGFTALGERLAAEGPAGTEELTRILNGYFGGLIAAVYGHGGDILKFAGDALLAIWPAESGYDELRDVALRAARCALALQEHMRVFDPKIAMRLSLHVGLDVGEISLAEVGGVGGRWEVLVVGSILDSLGELGQGAPSGQVHVSPAAWELIGGACAGESATAGFRLTAVRTPPVPKPIPAIELPADIGEALGSYVPEAVRSRLVAQLTGWLAELRHLAIVFARLPDLAHATPLKAADTVMRAAQTVFERFEGSINKLSVDDKGVSVLGAWGLPPHSHEDNAVRAIRAAMALRDALADLGHRCSVGVTTGRVFCGEVGNDLRREFTILGDTVNLAARLMVAAADDVLCDRATVEEAETKIAFEERPALSLKGKTGLMRVFRPVRQVDLPVRGDAVRMVGRAEERALLLEALAAVQEGQRRYVLVEGEPGIGKTCLVQDFLTLARARGSACHVAQADAFDRGSPYLIWRPVLAALLGVTLETDPALRRARVTERLGLHPEASHLAPLIAPLLGVDMPENSLTLAMSEQVRADNTHTAAIALIKDAAASGPLVLALEDGHWFDSLSWALISAVHEDVPGCLLLVTNRPLGAVPRGLERLMTSHDGVIIELEPLMAAQAQAVACQRLGVRSLPSPVAGLIQDRSEGHPFFAGELALALRGTGAIAMEGDDCVLRCEESELAALDLPRTVEGLVTSRIDKLEANEQLVLKIGSVVGRQFGFEIIDMLYPVAEDRPLVPQRLLALVRAGLLDEWVEKTYDFRHHVTQQVAYNLMLYAQRQRLHEAVARWIESAYGEDLTNQYGPLAHHWELGGLPDKAVDCLEAAGARALREGAHQEAVDYLTRAVSLLQARPSRERLASCERLLGKAHLGLGRLPDAGAHYERALDLRGCAMPEGSALAAIDLAKELAVQVARRLGLARPRRTPPGPDRDALAERIGIHEGQVEVYFLGNKLLEGFLVSLSALNQSERLGPSPQLARAYSTTSAILGLIPAHGAASHYADLARAVLKDVEDPSAHAYALYPLGFYNAGIGAFERALADLEPALAYFERLGDRRQWALTKGIAESVPLLTGSFSQFMAGAERLHAFCKRQGDLQLQAAALNFKAIGHLRLGRPPDEALRVLESAARYLESSSDQHEIALSLGLKVVACSRLGDARGAAQNAAAALALLAKSSPLSLTTVESHCGVSDFFLRAREHPAHAACDRRSLPRQIERALKAFANFARVFPIGGPRYLLYHGRRLWLDGKHEQAARQWRQGLARARGLGMHYDEGLLHFELARRLAPADPVRSGHTAEARRLFEATGAAYELTLLDSQGAALQ